MDRQSNRSLARISISVVCALVWMTDVVAQGPTSKPIAEAAGVQFHSDLLLNLHHTLYAAAWSGRADRTQSLAEPLPAPLTAPSNVEDRNAWDAAVAYYDRQIASRDLLFGKGMEALKTALVAGNLASDAVGAELRTVLESARPIYEREYWPDHDRANRAWIADTMERLKPDAPVTIAALEKLYATNWFTSPVRADVVWVANRQGAYTTVGPPPHATIGISNRGWSAVETVYHEFSHVLVLPLQQRLARALGDRLRDHRVLWHVVQFYLTGAAVQQVLKSRGIEYTPYLDAGLFDRAWPQYRKPIEANWPKYVQGAISLDEAIDGTIRMLGTK